MQLHYWDRQKEERYCKVVKVVEALQQRGGDIMKTPDSIADLYAAFAQAESQTRSESIKSGIQNRMRSGKTILNHRQFLGYTKRPDGVLQIVLEEAEIIRKIFDLYIQGNGVRKIKSIWNLTASRRSPEKRRGAPPPLTGC